MSNHALRPDGNRSPLVAILAAAPAAAALCAPHPPHEVDTVQEMAA